MDNVRQNEEWNVQLETSQDDPLLGESYVKFAFQGLQHQLSQGAGGWTLTEGRRTSYYKLIDSALPARPVNCGAREGFLRRHRYFASGACVAPRAGSGEGPLAASRAGADRKQVDEATAAVDKNPQSAGKPLLART